MSHVYFEPLTEEQELQVREAIQALKSDDGEEPLRVLWGFFADAVKRFAKFVIEKHAEAALLRRVLDEDDIASDVFSRLYEREVPPEAWDKLESSNDLWRMLAFLVRRSIADQARRQRGRIPRTRGSGGDPSIMERLDDAPAYDPTPYELAGEYDYAQRLLGVFRENDELRSVVALQLEGLSPAEIASRLGLSEAEFKRRRTRIGRELSKRIRLLRFGEEDETAEPPAEPAPMASLASKPRARRDSSAGPDAPPLDPVDCAVFAPPQVGIGQTFMVQVLAHMPPQAADAQALAKQFDAEAERRGFTSLETEVERGSRLTVTLKMPGLKIDQRLRGLTWRGEPAGVQFPVTVPGKHPGGTVVGTATICQDQVPMGRISFKVSVVAKKSEAPAPVPTGDAKAFEVFFISYASEDRKEVIKRVQMLKRLGKRFFQDLLHLDPGDRWEKELYRRIDDSDAVLLFWSSNAKKSKWVMRECRYTIRNKGIDYLLPVIIEGPPPVKPPPSLRDLHMNDWLLYVIEADKRRTESDTGG